MTETASVVVGSVGLGLVALASLPSVLSIYRKLRPRKDSGYHKVDVLYEDGDGAATVDSQRAFSTVLPRSFALVGSIIGFLFSVVAAVLNTVHYDGVLVVESWLTFGSWAFLLLQSLNLFFVHRPLDRFNLGVFGAFATLLIIVATCVENAFLRSRIDSIKPYTVHVALTAIRLGIALITLVSFLSLQRRPAIFTDGQPVDAEFTVSIFSRFTFSWADPILTFARKNKSLGLEDLPRVSQFMRARFLQAKFNSHNSKSRLWRQVIYNFRFAFLQQFILIVTIGVTQFGPQYAMFNLLKLLEQRSEGTQVAAVAWAWVFGLGLFMFITSLLESWLFWIVWSHLGLPIRAMLSILIFMKSTRRKDVKGVQRAKIQVAVDAISSNEPVINDSSGPSGEDTAATTEKEIEGDDEESSQKSRQSTINLVGVDSKRVSDFSCYAYIFPGAATKLIVSMCFLYTLIGARSLSAGLATFAISVPINVFFSKRYNSAQGELMKLRDQKMAVVTEALQGIRQIKFSALERQWQAKIGAKRSQELGVQWVAFKYDTGLICLWIFGPVMLSAVSLAVYSYLFGDLSPSIAFTTIAIFGQIEATLASVPELTTEALDAWVSINRIEQYLNAPEKVDCTELSDHVYFENASIAWPSDSQEEDPDRFVLKDVSIRFPPKELSVISGKTGSGKSLLLAAILGEVDKISGTIKVPKALSVEERFDHKATKGNWVLDSSIAFVAQIPWIENATIKDNILFGLPFDVGRYNKVLSVCALEKDLDMLPDGEMTDIGANGINLSGGQRWRVSFARALYSRAGILVLDDIFSALDAHVGRQLFEEALTGELGTGRTRILVTHHVGLCLPKTKYTVSLGEGTVEHAGLVEDLQRTGSMAQILKREESEELENAEKEELIEEDNDKGNTLARVLSRRSAIIDDGGADTKGKLQAKKFTEDEKRETGSIKVDLYTEYITQSGGLKMWLPLALLFIGYMSLILGRSWWVSLWTRSYNTESLFAQHHLYQQIPRQGSSDFEARATSSGNTWYYLGIYVGLSVIIVVIGTLRFFFTFIAAIKASRIMFEKLSYTVLRAPLRWLDTVPVGRVLNRFTADFNVLDSRIANDMGFFAYQVLELFGIMVAGLIVSPFVLIFAFGLMSISFFVAIRYLTGAREVKRLESNAKSPIFEQFGSALAGVGTIRAFDKTEEYIQRMYQKIDNHSRAFWHMWLFNRWMGFRLSIVGACFAVLVAGIIVSNKTIDASLAGFALAFALQYTGAIIWVLRSYANLEMNMNAMERIVEYTRIATEDQSGVEAPAAWPTEGRLEVEGLVAGYALDLPPVLKGLSFTAEKNQRVGVVGRTGAGKSSLTLALFRFLEAREGTIIIDGIDVSKITLHDLRSRLAIIPQDPVLFSGTVRSNLDAFDEHTDAELRDALERVHLIQGTGLISRDELAEASASGSATPTAADTNTNIFNSLSSKISEGGLNLSQGQRQLLCLARAIVSHPKIMVLDEATSAVDMATDVLIQRSIREEFGDSTLLVIAHRLSTIADFDRILVMSDGRALEYGSPRELYEKQGQFFEMIGQSGEKDQLEHIILGNGEGGSKSPSGTGSTKVSSDNDDGSS
ncbi:hypothetical protein MMC17_003013 [Xylographa soralifera]|nr:hypothetical protein [Xylographa soralifera]